jgi:hypothetical protein
LDRPLARKPLLEEPTGLLRLHGEGPALEAIEGEPKFGYWGDTGQRNYQSCKRWALQS